MLPPITARTPLEFATLYLPVIASSPATGEVRAVVRQYVSSDGLAAMEQKDHPYKKLLGFYEAAGAAGEHEVQRIGGEKYVLTIPPLGLYQTDIRYSVKQCHMGKGNPAHLRHLALLYTYWDQKTRATTGGFKPSQQWASVQQYADAHVGVDCNGFVGAYFQCCFPGTGLGPHDDIPAGVTLTAQGGVVSAVGPPFAQGGKLRTGLGQIRPGDVTVHNHRHIALLGDNLYPDLYLVEEVKTGKQTATHTTGQFRVYQARGKKAGGVQGGVYEIKHTGGHEFKIRDVYDKTPSWETLKAIVRPKGVPE